MPVEPARLGLVLLRVPQLAVAHRVDRHRTVVAPAVERVDLDPAAPDDHRFPLQPAQRLAAELGWHRRFAKALSESDNAPTTRL
jgi:hypothetical protein